MNDHTTRTPRPLGVAHLIFGLVFSGIAATWIIGRANDTDVPDLAIGVPIVLIGAGIIGLAASVFNQRRNRARLLAAASTNHEATGYEPTLYDAPESPVEETTTLTTPIEDNR